MKFFKLFLIIIIVQMGGDLCKGNQQEILDLKVGADENLYEVRFFHLNPLALITRSNLKFPDTYLKIDRTQYTQFKQEGTYIGKVCKIKHGLGIMIYENEGFYYIGQWINNNRQGLGYMLYKDGSYYQGQWYQNKPHGYGEYYNPDKNWFFKGKWRAGKKHGIGQQTYPDGAVYKGNYSQDLKQGDGIFIFSSDCLINSINPLLNTTNLRGTEGARGSKKCTFKGKFNKDMATGFGFQRGENYVYQGQFSENDFNGAGKTSYFQEDPKISDVYIGQFKQGLKHGYGEYRWSDGRVYKGQWQQGQIISRGVFIDKTA